MHLLLTSSGGSRFLGSGGAGGGGAEFTFIVGGWVCELLLSASDACPELRPSSNTGIQGTIRVLEHAFVVSETHNMYF